MHAQHSEPDWPRYRVFGLVLQSELPLTELVEADPEATPDVVIRRQALGALTGEKPGQFSVDEGGGLLSVPDVGRYRIRDGREIIVDPDPRGSERHLRLYLLGSALGVALLQRGVLPLHANAMLIGGKAVAFMGASGAGKSTMAAWFHDNGFSVLADDVCAVTFDASGRPEAWPGIPRLRLWRDALEESGRDPAEHEHAFDDADKYNVRTRTEDRAAPVPLGAIYLLDERSTSKQEARITPLSGIDALDALVANTYRGGYIPMLGGVAAYLKACAAVARSTPVFKVDRRWGKDVYDEQMRALEAHAAAVIEGKGG
jgi:hypothetical protein